MATQATTQPGAQPYTFFYHASAELLRAGINLPVTRQVNSGPLQLPQQGGYEFQPANSYHLEAIVSYDSGYTQVSGFQNTNGNTTLTSAVLEGLNILDVVTADRIVAQITTVHPPDGQGQVPSISFVGTRFDNLRVNGAAVDVTRCLDILGPKPSNDASYFDDAAVLERIAAQAATLPDWARGQGNDTSVQDISQAGGSSLYFSLVSNLECTEGSTFGHVIVVPHFGRIFLAEVRLDRKRPRTMSAAPTSTSSTDNDTYSIHLEMMRAELSGGSVDGTIHGNPCDSNGTGSGGEHRP